MNGARPVVGWEETKSLWVAAKLNNKFGGGVY